MTKVELFEAIRVDKFKRDKSIRGIARERGVHRRTVRQALESAIPAPPKRPKREPPVLTVGLRGVIDAWLRDDKVAPRKQRHTARRVFQRLCAEHGFKGAESTIRQYVGRRRRELGLSGKAFVPLDHVAGEEAEVDWYEAEVDFPDGRRTVQFFQMRACFSGREFHMAFPRQTQQAFLQAHVAAFAFFGGVFHSVRYDNLKAAVKKVLRGRRREESDRFIALRSHYLYDSEFCRAGLEGAHEKGGVEGAVGRFRRRHLVPVPSCSDFEALNRQLRAACVTDEERRIEGRARTIREDWEEEQGRLQALPKQAFDPSEICRPRVDTKGRVLVRTNRYSVPLRLVGLRVEARIGALEIEMFHSGQRVAVHERLQGRHGERLELDHYLELLEVKPGALSRSKPLRQARDRGCWPEDYDRLWEELKRRYGEAKGTGHLLKVLMLHRESESRQVHEAVSLALELGACDANAVRMLLRQLEEPERFQAAPLGELGALSRFDRPVRAVTDYDQLLASVLAFVSPLAILLEVL